MLIRKQKIFSDMKVIKDSKLRLLKKKLTTMRTCNSIIENGIYLEDIQFANLRHFLSTVSTGLQTIDLQTS